MEKQDPTSTTSTNAIIKHVFKFDDDTKSNLMNIAQYTLLSLIPVAILQNVSEKLFPEFDGAKGTLELLAEIVGQTLMALLGLFFTHRLITAVPTFSGTAMGEQNLFNIIVVFLLSSFMFDGKIKKKFQTISDRMFDLWDGKSDDKKQKPQQQQQPQQGGGSVVSISQPISRGGAPAHSPSRADYMSSPNAMSSTTQMMPPPPQQQPPSQAAQQPAVQEQYSNNPSEPAAYNDGGGSAFAAF
jgi:hypothetical protein